MNGFDIVVLILLGYAVISGFRSGLVRQTATLLAVLLGGWFSGMLAPYLTGWIGDWGTEYPEMVRIATHLLAFCLIATVLYVGAFFLGKVLNTLGLSLFNRLGGACVGLFTALIVVSVVINMILVFDVQSHWMKEESRKESKFFYPLQKVSSFVFPYLKEVNKEIQKFKKEVIEGSQKLVPSKQA